MRRREWQRRLAQINTRELAALRGEAPFAPPFDAPPAADHRYAEDLEIFEGDRLVFDYRLREGACDHFNALSLTRAVGIHLDDPERASLQDPA